MITNKKQYHVTRKQIELLQLAVAEFDFDEARKRLGSKILAKAELEGMQSEYDVLVAQASEYEQLASGAVQAFRVTSLEDLPKVLIKTRIAQGLTQSELATKLGLKQQQIQRYEAEMYQSTSLKRLVQVAEALQIGLSEIAEPTTAAGPAAKRSASKLPWGQFPIVEIYKRNWLPWFTGTLVEAKANAEALVEEFVRRALPRPAPALMRRRLRIRATVNPYALLAWQCRVLSLAKTQEVKRCKPSRLLDSDTIQELVQLSGYDDGPRRAVGFLAKHGVRLVVEPHLTHTHLDGAALLPPDGIPVIGMTLRYDRLDNFWFVLLHEVAHVCKHLCKGRVEEIFDDLEKTAEGVEQEADGIAAEALLPEGVWETAVARYLQSEDSVRELAKTLAISPSIIAGRIRNESGKYTLLNTCIGLDEVRRQFPEVAFSR